MATPSSQQASAPDLPRTAAVSGVVVNGATGRPLAGVVVRLTGPSLGRRLGVVTDSRGRFVFPDLPAGDGYSLSATRPGYESGALMPRSIVATGARFSLREGEWRADVVLDLWPLGSISGLVLDEREEPVVDVPVRAHVRTLVAGTGYWVDAGVARTDDRGLYRIGGLPRGTYLVSVPSVLSAVPPSTPLHYLSGMSLDLLSALRMSTPRIASIDAGAARLAIGQYAVSPVTPDMSWTVYPLVFYGGARSSADAMPINLAHGEPRRGVDVVLAPVPAVRVSGRLVGPVNVIAGLSVRLLPAASRAMGPESEQATALSADDGTFQFPAVPAGAYLLRAGTSSSQMMAFGGQRRAPVPAIPGAGTAERTLVTVGDVAVRSDTATGDQYFAEQYLEVGSNSVDEVALVLERGGVLRGRVERDDGNPLPATVPVEAEAASGDPELGRPATRIQTAQARSAAFSIQGFRRGEYVLRVPVYGLMIKSISTAAGDHTARPLSMAPGVEVTDVVVTLTARAATLTGPVRAADGQPAGAAAVIVFPVEPAGWTNYGMSSARIRSILSLNGSGYRVAGLPAGQYFVIAVEPGLHDAWKDPAFLKTAAALADRVTLDWGVETVRDVTVRAPRAR